MQNDLTIECFVFLCIRKARATHGRGSCISLYVQHWQLYVDMTRFGSPAALAEEEQDSACNPFEAMAMLGPLH